MCLVVALLGLAIGLSVPGLAQEQNTVDPEVRRQIEALIVKFDEAYNRSDAVAIADLFTPDAVQVWEWESAGGVASGQQAIEKRYEAQFATSPRKLVRKRRVDCFGLAAIRSATDRNWSVVTRRPESSAPVTFGITWRSSVGVWSLRAGFFSRSISSRVITGCGVLASFSIGSEACQAAFHRRSARTS
jgi:uncharacterized protein (TIGR02246 family)